MIEGKTGKKDEQTGIDSFLPKQRYSIEFLVAKTKPDESFYSLIINDALIPNLTLIVTYEREDNRQQSSLELSIFDDITETSKDLGIKSPPLPKTELDYLFRIILIKYRRTDYDFDTDKHVPISLTNKKMIEDAERISLGQLGIGIELPS